MNSVWRSVLIVYSTITTFKTLHAQSEMETNDLNRSEISRSSEVLNLCGYLIIPNVRRLEVFEGQKIPQKVFSEVFKKFINGSVIMLNEQCQIEICGFVNNADNADYGFGDCIRFSTVLPATNPIFTVGYQISSISCGCKKNHTNCQLGTCNVTTSLQGRPRLGECAILYQERDCRDCFYDGIRMESGGFFEALNSVAIKSILIRPKCWVRVETFGYLSVSFPHSNVDHLQKSENDIRPTYFREGEVFQCTCSSTKTSSLPSSTYHPTTVTESSETNTFINRTENVSQIQIETKPTGKLNLLINSSFTDEEKESKESESTDLSSMSSKYVIISIVGVGVLLVISGIVIMVGWIYLVRFRSSRNKNPAIFVEPKQFPQGETDEANIPLHELPAENPVEINSLYDSKYEIPREQIVFDASDPNSRIGAGAFGLVYKGTIRTFDENRFSEVAIKTVNPQTFDSMIVESLLNEIKVHAYLTQGRECPYIVYFLGACTVNLQRGEVFNVLEFCALGSLHNYLKSQDILLQAELEAQISQGQNASVSPYSVDPSGKTPKIPQALFNNLVKWSKEIAIGMDYLSIKAVLHIDLATRNVLLMADMTAKISDFGLSRRLYHALGYVSTGNTPKPFKWLAMESLMDSKYSVKSDVWAYGVTLWEIFNLEKEPYPLIEGPELLLCYLKQDNRLQKPKHVSDKIYNQMQKCWNAKPESRPGFPEMKEFFQQMQKHYQSEVVQNN